MRRIIGWLQKKGGKSAKQVGGERAKLRRKIERIKWDEVYDENRQGKGGKKVKEEETRVDKEDEDKVISW